MSIFRNSFECSILCFATVCPVTIDATQGNVQSPAVCVFSQIIPFLKKLYVYGIRLSKSFPNIVCDKPSAKILKTRRFLFPLCTIGTISPTHSGNFWD